ncbi:dehydrogenase [Porphyromonas crevioricanis]|uniref:dGTP triphosphohydrolase n=1 Tax=Porphyromonas crevioricanis TaxID=393921 RepID=UPI00052DF0DD|nr:dNTP triphosphohydrolase [Porphyromonas crevioricanis]KGN90840.1 dehydrogenase [Porphyromonas crevioricanis]
MQWQQLLSDKRLGLEGRHSSSTGGVRTDFERDYDRMVFSSPFRRLQNKTQVFPLPGNVFVHNRLTHSLEVSCVGRSLGSIITHTLRQRHGSDIFPTEGAISSIVSAACLAHDMGNPPFGHSGERAIGAYFSEGNGRIWEEQVRRENGRWEDFLHFEGNANAFRLLTHQFVGRRPGGFALTYSTLASIIKYPHSSLAAGRKGKFGFFASEEDTMKRIADHLGLIKLSEEPLRYARYPLVYLVEAADDICYQIMDLEDAYKLKIFTECDTTDLLMDYFAPDQRDEIRLVLKCLDDSNERIAYLRSRVINTLAEACADTFLEAEERILDGSFEGSLIAQISERERSAYRTCSRLAYERIYPARDVLDVELAGHQIFGYLIDRLMHALTHPDYAYSRSLLSRVSSQYDTHRQDIYGKLQCTLDYISGMTDIYALDLYRKITGMSLPAI